MSHPCSAEGQTEPPTAPGTGRYTKAHSKWGAVRTRNPAQLDLAPFCSAPPSQALCQTSPPQASPPGPSATNQKWSRTKPRPLLWTRGAEPVGEPP